MEYFWIVKRISFPFSIFEETRSFAIFDRPPDDEKNNFTCPNKVLLDRIDRVREISKAD